MPEMLKYLGKSDTSFLSVYVQNSSQQIKDAGLKVEDLSDSWHITNADATIRAKIKKRQAYPGTYCRQLDSTTVQFGYGSEDRDEFLTITLRADASLTVTRDEFAVLPLFYHSDASRFVLSNEYADVVAAVKRPMVRKSAIIDHLMMVDRPAPPPVEGIDVLKEQETLLFEAGKGVRLTQPPHRDWRFSTDVRASDPKAFFSTFSEYLDYFIETRFSGQTFAFEVSGGLDSATLPQYFHDTTQQPICMASLLFGPPYDVSQREKLEAIAVRTSGTSVSSVLDPATVAPLSEMTTPRYAESIYLEAFVPLIRQLRDLGIKVLATGDGGDEFFQNVTRESFGMPHGKQAQEIRKSMRLPSFFTPAFHEAYIASSPSTPIFPLPHRPANAGYGQLANNALIREDIWPVSPFSSPHIYNYFQSLPAHFRANKNILRAFHQAKGFAEPVYNATGNEYFDVFFKECFKAGSFDELFEMLVPNARTIAMGYVDEQKARHANQQAKRGSGGDALFRLYCFLALEASLHLSCAKLVM